MNKKWHVRQKFGNDGIVLSPQALVEELIVQRGVKTEKERKQFLAPPHPDTYAPGDVGIDEASLAHALSRIEQAITNKESVVVYADYDADGITAGAIMWETLWKLGARAMPYIPHRVDEGYGLSKKGIDNVREQYDPKLVITVDHGITAAEQVAYAQSLGIDVIITDHHVAPEHAPDTTIVHTTALSGSGVSWFVAKELLKRHKHDDDELIVLPAIGTIADLLPLVGINRAIVKYGLAAMRKTQRVGLNALIRDAGIEKHAVDTYSVSHMLAPRLNAMGRLEHALDALRLLCTTDTMKAKILATKLGVTNKERQQLTVDTVMHAKELVPQALTKLLFIAHETYNPGVIGLVAGRLVEEYYRPSIVLSVGAEYAKASARSVAGFNIVEAIRACSDMLVDVGGHPMAAGFTVETKNLEVLKHKLVEFAEKTLTDDMLTRVLAIDGQIPFAMVTTGLWEALQTLQPFGFGNPEPVFATRSVTVVEARIIGATKKHLKLRVKGEGNHIMFDAVAFNMADLYGQLQNGPVDLAYTIDMNEWNGKRSLQLKVKDIVIPQ